MASFGDTVRESLTAFFEIAASSLVAKKGRASASADGAGSGKREATPPPFNAK